MRAGKLRFYQIGEGSQGGHPPVAPFRHVYLCVVFSAFIVDIAGAPVGFVINRSKMAEI